MALLGMGFESGCVGAKARTAARILSSDGVHDVRHLRLLVQARENLACGQMALIEAGLDLVMQGQAASGICQVTCLHTGLTPCRCPTLRSHLHLHPPGRARPLGSLRQPSSPGAWDRLVRSAASGSTNAAEEGWSSPSSWTGED